jgi:acetyltransferase
MEKKLETPGLRFFIQKYLPQRLEVIVGAQAERDLGHMIMFGMGGVMVEVLKDVAFELTPVTAPEARAMLTSIKASPLLSGFRGQKGVNQDKLVEIIQRISQLVSDLPAIQEMDLNPLIACEDDIYVVDARIIL